MSPTHSDDVAAILGHSGGPDDRLLYSQRQELAALQAEHDDLWKRHARQLDRESEWIKENEALRARVAELERVLDGYRGQVDRFGNSPAGEVLGASASAGTGET